LDPWQRWDHKSEKVTEHQTHESSNGNGAIALVGVNLVPPSFSWLLSWPGQTWQKFFSSPLHWWETSSSSRLEKGR